MARNPEHASHFPHIPVPDLKGAARWTLTHWKPAGLALATFAGGAYLALAHDRGPSVPPQEPSHPQDTFKPPEGGQGVGIVPNTTPESTATEEANPPTPTVEPEVKKCLVFGDCSEVEFFIKPNASGVDVLYAGANPIFGTLIYARRDGQRGAIDLDTSSSLKGTRITVRDPNLNDPEGVDYMTGDIIPLDPEGNVNYNSIAVKRGQIIGKIGSSGVTNDGYKFIHTIGKVDPTTGKAITGVEELKNAYEGAPEKPIKRVSRNTQSPPSSPPFTSGPPVFKD